MARPAQPPPPSPRGPRPPTPYSPPGSPAPANDNDPQQWLLQLAEDLGALAAELHRRGVLESTKHAFDDPNREKDGNIPTSGSVKVEEP
jgi:hypothetical protein